MPHYDVVLSSMASDSYRCQRAANSLDIDVTKKLSHRLSVDFSPQDDWRVGIIYGASGSGKTTLAKKVFGDDAFGANFDLGVCVLDQMPADMSYDDCARLLTGVGLTSVPCWLKPIGCLSNGQKDRAFAALALSSEREVVVLDEFSSTVDRTAAMAMCLGLSKFLERGCIRKRVVFVTCHYDVVSWLSSDWRIDCNAQEFDGGRLERRESLGLSLEIRETDGKEWRHFSKYHYLSDRLPCGVVKYFGLFVGDRQIGFQCFANYVPHVDKTKPMQMHFNRTVILPDFVGLGIGSRLINATSKIMARMGYDIRAKFSSEPVYRSLTKSSLWALVSVDRKLKNKKGKIGRGTQSMRSLVKTYSFRFIDDGSPL